MAAFDTPDMSDMTLAASSAEVDVDRGTPSFDGDHSPRRVLSAGTLAGDRVRNSAGEDLGKIEEIMLDVPTGRIAYAVLSFGGFLGMGNKLFAVPWEALTLNERDHEFILDVDRTVLEKAPGFDKDDWPDMADPHFGTEVHQHYGYKPYWESSERTTGTDELEETGEKDETFDRDRNRTLRSGGGSL